MPYRQGSLFVPLLAKDFSVFPDPGGGSLFTRPQAVSWTCQETNVSRRLSLKEDNTLKSTSAD